MVTPAHEREWKAEQSLNKALRLGVDPEEWLETVAASASEQGKKVGSVLPEQGYSLSDAREMYKLYIGDI